MKQIYFKCLSFLLFSLMAMTAYAQKSVTGTVTEKSGQPIPGVSVTEKGTKNGTSTGTNGKFTLSVKSGAILTFTSVGLATKEIAVGQSATLSVVLEEDANALNEVVVTALGIKREKKSLGYAVQEVKGETLVEAREPNITNALTGKVAGLQIVRSSNGPGGSSKINLRGNNSLTGDNQPLIVVDGVPMNNFVGAVNGENKVNSDFFNPATDMGNGLSDINPEDIESISTLKGPTASALYGSRAGNGVIMITTKSGKLQKGLGITVSSTLGIENIFTNPKMQNVYGQGDNNVFDQKARISWGPKIEGQSVTNWNGQQESLSAHDNVKNYLDQGISSNQSVSFQQQVNSTAIYTSFNRLDDKSIIPGAELHRTNLMARAVSKFGKDERWVTDTKIQYNNTNAENRPANGSNSNNIFSTLYSFPRSLDITQLNPSVDADGKMIWYDPTDSRLNPYWAKDYNLNQDVRDRFLMNGSLKYNFNSWLNAEVKAGADKYTTTTETKLYAGNPNSATGNYSLGKQSFTETNFSALISGHQDNLFGRLGGAFSVGGNLMSQTFNALSSSSGNLVVPNLFSLNNGQNAATVTQVLTRKKINSLYGTAQVNWDGYLFVDGTFRNDWTSTLSPANRSYFYPSVSLSYVISEMFTKMDKELPSWLSYAKLRASAATVGNDMNAYQLYNTYIVGKDPLQSTNAARGETLFDPNVKNELIKSYEAGLEMRFLKSRFGLDFSVYRQNATNQLVKLPMDPLSGYKFKMVNLGDIQNSGIELMVDANVLNNPNSLNWNLSLNYSHNNNQVKALSNDVKQYSLAGFDAIQILAVEGQKYGDIYGNKFKRVEGASAEFNGQILLDENGLPQKGEQNAKLGNQQADALIGITNTFHYKGFNLSFLVDGRFGGKIFSSTLAVMQVNGTASTTVGNGSREMIADGVVLNTSTNEYEKNTKSVPVQQYWGAIFGGNSNIGITEANIYDASNIRLRNVNLSYSLSQKALAKTPFQSAKIGASCNNVWLITSHMNGLDPESVFATGTNAVGFESFSAPTTRTFSFNLTLGF